MTVYPSGEDRIHHRSAAARALQGLARVCVRRINVAFRIIHRAIVLAKTDRIHREMRFHKIPQWPVILDKKWDF